MEFVARLTRALVSNIAMALQILNLIGRVVFPNSFSLACKDTLFMGTGFLFLSFGFLQISFVSMLCFLQNSPTFGNSTRFSHRLGLIFSKLAKGIVQFTRANINAWRFSTSFSRSWIGMFCVDKGIQTHSLQQNQVMS